MTMDEPDVNVRQYNIFARAHTIGGSVRDDWIELSRQDLAQQEALASATDDMVVEAKDVWDSGAGRGHHQRAPLYRGNAMDGDVRAAPNARTTGEYGDGAGGGNEPAGEEWAEEEEAEEEAEEDEAIEDNYIRAESGDHAESKARGAAGAAEPLLVMNPVSLFADESYHTDEDDDAPLMEQAPSAETVIARDLGDLQNGNAEVFSLDVVEASEEKAPQMVRQSRRPNKQFCYMCHTTPTNLNGPTPTHRLVLQRRIANAVNLGANVNQVALMAVEYYDKNVRKNGPPWFRRVAVDHFLDHSSHENEILVTRHTIQAYGRLMRKMETSELLEEDPTTGRQSVRTSQLKAYIQLQQARSRLVADAARVYMQ